MDLSDLIARNAAFSPHKPALVFEGEVLSYRVFFERIETTARALKAEFGVGRGDRVAILSLNRPDYLVLLYACARLGAMLVPLNWRLAAAEQMFILSDAAAKVLVLEQSFAEILPALGSSASRYARGRTGLHAALAGMLRSTRCWRTPRATAAIRIPTSPARC